MAAHVRYVKPRNGVFQYVRRVPKSVLELPVAFERCFKSQPLFRRSLKTKDRSAIFAAAQAANDEFEALVADALGKKPPAIKRPARALRSVTQADLDRITEQFREMTVTPYNQAYLRADASERYRDDYERMFTELETYAEEITAALQPGAVEAENGPTTPRSSAIRVIEEQGFDAPQGSDDFNLIVAAIRAGRIAGLRHVQELAEGKAAPPAKKARVEKRSGGLTLREATDRYISHKGFSGKPQSEINLCLKIFESLIGSKPLAELKRADFTTYVDHLSQQVVGGKSADSVTRPVSAQTVKKRLGIFRAVINFAITRDWFEGPNPAAGIDISAFVKKPDKAVMPDKRRFKIDELNAVLRHPWFTGCKSAKEPHIPGTHRLKGAEFWVPITAIFTGCRASELGGLKLSEVVLEGETPHLVIRPNEYRPIKNSEARDVPLLDALVELGFKDYVQRIAKTGADRVFPDWTSPPSRAADWGNSKLVRAFNRTVVPTMLKQTLPAGARVETTFHNLRGTFKGMLVSSPKSLHPNIINEVLGHAKGEMDARYVGKVPIDVTYDAIRDCNYKGLILPPPPP